MRRIWNTAGNGVEEREVMVAGTTFKMANAQLDSQMCALYQSDNHTLVGLRRPKTITIL